MVMLLNGYTALRRLAVFGLVFVVLFILLRTSAYNSYSDYLPTIKSPFTSSSYDSPSEIPAPPIYEDETTPDLDKPEYDEAPNFSTLPIDDIAPQEPSVDEFGRPEDVFGNPDDILPEIQELPPVLESTKEAENLQEEEPSASQSGAQQSTEKQEGATKSEPEQHEEEAVNKPTSSPRSRLNLEMQQFLTWDPPIENKNHYPPYDAYGTRDFDPNRWEGFEQNDGIYVNGTTDKLPTNLVTPADYNPYPYYNSAGWLETWKGDYVSCDGPAGVPYNQSSDDDFVRAFRAVPEGFPKPDIGSFQAVGLNGEVCFDRHARLDPYRVAGDHEELDFSKVQWGRLQNECLIRNNERYKNSDVPVLKPSITKLDETMTQEEQAPATESFTSPINTLDEANEDSIIRFAARQDSQELQYKSRSAVLIRTWDSYDYQDNDHMAIRSLISELSLQSGGEYQVFLFVHVKDASIPIFSDEAVYAEKLAEYVPEEFRDLAILWNEEISKLWYPNVGEWSVYFQQWMPLQWFSKTHPEFDYLWNWEMDARYIGNHYHFVEQISNFASQQPRKYMWERNSRYYIPSVHGNWDEFLADTHNVVASSPYVDTVWGPQPWSSQQKTNGPSPPTSEHDDHFSWGVGEEADFITLLPMWDPRNTMWAYRNKLWNYPSPDEKTEEQPYPQIPRRTFINTLVRLSSKLLHAMHEENELGQSMAAEMWPASVSLQHGFKAVYAPHPIWASNRWPGEYLDAVINADGWGAGASGTGGVDAGHGAAFDEERERQGLPQEGTGPNREGKAGRWSAERDSVYSPDREHNLGGLSWYFWSDFPKTLYWRWLGWQSNFTIVTSDGPALTDARQGLDWVEYEQQHGHLCLPGMLLHPVKNVQNLNMQPFADEVAAASSDNNQAAASNNDLNSVNEHDGPMDTINDELRDTEEVDTSLTDLAGHSTIAWDTAGIDGMDDSSVPHDGLTTGDASNSLDAGRPAGGFPVDISTADIQDTAQDTSNDAISTSSSYFSPADTSSGLGLSDSTSTSNLDHSRPFDAGSPPNSIHNSYFDDGSRMPPQPLDAVLPGDASWPGTTPHSHSPAVAAPASPVVEDDVAAAFGANAYAGSAADVSTQGSQRVRPGEVSEDAYGAAFEAVNHGEDRVDGGSFY